MYLQLILKRNDDEITKQVILAQTNDCYDGDFLAQTEKDMKNLSITRKYLTSVSKETLKLQLVEKVNEAAFQFLMSKAENHSKVNKELYTSCEGSSYFSDSRFTPDLANLLFKFRTRGFLVKNNFRNNYQNTNIMCPLCEDSDDTQEHLFECKAMRDVTSEDVQYNDIFSSETEVLLNVAMNLKRIVGQRETLLNPDR